MKQIKEGMAFHPTNAYTKYWIYKREGQWYLIYPMRHKNLSFQGFRVPADSFEDANIKLAVALFTDAIISE